DQWPAAAARGNAWHTLCCGTVPPCLPHGVSSRLSSLLSRDGRFVAVFRGWTAWQCRPEYAGAGLAAYRYRHFVGHVAHPLGGKSPWRSLARLPWLCTGADTPAGHHICCISRRRRWLLLAHHTSHAAAPPILLSLLWCGNSCGRVIVDCRDAIALAWGSMANALLTHQSEQGVGLLQACRRAHNRMRLPRVPRVLTSPNES